MASADMSNSAQKAQTGTKYLSLAVVPFTRKSVDSEICYTSITNYRRPMLRVKAHNPFQDNKCVIAQKSNIFPIVNFHQNGCCGCVCLKPHMNSVTAFGVRF